MNYFNKEISDASTGNDIYISSLSLKKGEMTVVVHYNGEWNISENPHVEYKDKYIGNKDKYVLSFTLNGEGCIEDVYLKSVEKIQ